MHGSRTFLASLFVVSCLPIAASAQAPTATCAAALSGKGPVKVKLTTSSGPIVLQLEKEKAPVSTGNFAKYVDSGHYNGTVFHRVIDAFMIQGGGFTRDMRQKPVNAPIKNESTNGLKNDNYTVAMARTNVRDSATSQFFINAKANDFLNYSGESNPGYAVFGKVIEGNEVVDKVNKDATSSAAGSVDVPRE